MRRLLVTLAISVLPSVADAAIINLALDAERSLATQLSVQYRIDSDRNSSITAYDIIYYSLNVQVDTVAKTVQVVGLTTTSVPMTNTVMPEPLTTFVFESVPIQDVVRLTSPTAAVSWNDAGVAEMDVMFEFPETFRYAGSAKGTYEGGTPVELSWDRIATYDDARPRLHTSHATFLVSPGPAVKLDMLGFGPNYSNSDNPLLFSSPSGLVISAHLTQNGMNAPSSSIPIPEPTAAVLGVLGLLAQPRRIKDRG